MQLTQEQIVEWYKECPIHVTNLVKECLPFITKPSINLIDIGSNVGVFSELLAKHVVIDNNILFEPVEELYQFTLTNHPEWVHKPLVASDHNGVVKFNVEVGSNLGTSRVLDDGRDIVRNYQSVHIGNFLSANFPDYRPDFIKIDAEGHDVTIMLALVDYVDQLDNGCVLVFEVGYDTEYAEVVAAYNKIGYTHWCSSPVGSSGDVFVFPKTTQLPP